jgi:hypothetical protein
MIGLTIFFSMTLLGIYKIVIPRTWRYSGKPWWPIAGTAGWRTGRPSMPWSEMEPVTSNEDSRQRLSKDNERTTLTSKTRSNID